MTNPILPLFNIGPAITGSVLGSPYSQYRCATANNPISSPSLIRLINAWITGDPNGKGDRSPDAAKSWQWFGMFDATLTAPFDYLVGPMGTFFVMSQDVPHPIRLCRCSHTFTFTEPYQFTTPGKQPAYSGDKRSTEIAIASGWPGALIQGTKGDVGGTKLPSDVKMPWYLIFIPGISGVNLRNQLIITDENGQRYTSSSCERTSLGWRISAALATT